MTEAPSLRRQLSDQGRQLFAGGHLAARPDTSDTLADLEAQLARLRGCGPAQKANRQTIVQKAKLVGAALIGALKDELRPLLGTGPANKGARQQLKAEIR